ncbi:MAG: hypothetical protein ABJF23_23665 [Bryobacteraceae bacterium]
MLRKAFLAVSACCLASTAVYADFSYDQNSKITGGALAGMMKMAGAFSKAAREPMNSTVMVKGDRMAHVGANHISIIDLKSETITDIDPAKHSYSVITFADMAKAMQQMSDKMAAKGKQEGADMKMKASVKETGEKKMVSGFNTKEVVLTIEMEMADPKSGEKGTMAVVSDMWLAPDIPGYDEVREFYKRMATKIAWTPGAGGMAMQRGDMMKGMGELAKESAKLQGVPVLQIMKMGGAGDAAGSSQTRTETPKQAAPPAPTAGELAASAIAGRLGGFGGFGKKKKPAEEQPAETASAPAQSSDSSASLMEMTTESMNFSTAPIDGSRFEVPAGFKKVDHPMEKALR